MPTEIEIARFTFRAKRLLDHIHGFPANTKLAQIPRLFQDKMDLLRNWPFLTEPQKHTVLKTSESSYANFLYLLLATRITDGPNDIGFYALEEAVNCGNTKIVLFFFELAKDFFKKWSVNDIRGSLNIKYRLLMALHLSMETRQVQVVNTIRDFIYQPPLHPVGSSLLPDFDWKYWQIKNIDIAAQDGKTEPFEQHFPLSTDDSKKKAIAPLWYNNVKNEIRTYTVIGNWHSITLKKNLTDTSEITMIREHKDPILHGDTIEFIPEPGLHPYILMVAYLRASLHKQDHILKLLHDFPIPSELQEILNSTLKTIINNSSIIFNTGDKNKIAMQKGLASMFLNYYQKNNMKPPEELSKQIQTLKAKFNI